MRSTTLDAATRAFVGLVRGVMVKADDSKKLQEHDVRVFQKQLIRGVERLGSYGFMSVPMPADRNGKGAEVIVAFLGGNQSHPIIIGADDRRHRPKNWQPGEGGLYDDQGQTVRLTRDGIVVDGNGKTVTVKCGGASLTVTSDGNITAKPAAGKFVFVGGNGADGSYSPLLTVAGPMANAKGKIG